MFMLKMRSDRSVGLSHIHTQVRQREGPLQQRCKVCVRRVVCDFPVNTYYRSELTMVYVSLFSPLKNVFCFCFLKIIGIDVRALCLSSILCFSLT